MVITGIKVTPRSSGPDLKALEAEFSKLGNLEKIAWLAEKSVACTNDGEGARMFLYDLPWKNLFVIFHELEMVIAGARRRRRRLRAWKP